MDKQPVPDSMLQAVRQFANPRVAHDFFTQIRFPNGVACPRIGCGSADVTFYPKHIRWYCRECRKQFSAKVGTIFEDSPIGLNKWLPSVWLISSNRNGISSYELARGLGVTQKTAWFMLHRIREAMQDDTLDLMTGTVEVEAYIGGLTKNMNRKRLARHNQQGRGPAGKTPVLGMIERKGGVRAWSVPHVSAKTLLPSLMGSIDQDATVYTDKSLVYKHIHEYFVPTPQLTTWSRSTFVVTYIRIISSASGPC